MVIKKCINCALLNYFVKIIHNYSLLTKVGEVGEMAVRGAVELLGVKLAWLGLVEPDGSIKCIAHYPEHILYPKKIEVRWDHPRLGLGPTGRAVLTGSPQVCKDITKDKTFAPWRREALKWKLKSSAAFPMIVSQKTIGTLNLYSDKSNFFTEEKIFLAQHLANITGGFIQNALMHEASLMNIKKIEALRNIDLAITGTTDARVMFNIILKEITSILNADGAAIFLWNSASNSFEFAGAEGFRGGEASAKMLSKEGLLRKLITAQNILRYDVDKDFLKYPIRRKILMEENFVSCSCVPMRSKEKFVGILEVYTRRKIDQRDWDEFLLILSKQVTIAIENARLVIDLAEKHAELLRACDETIEGWAKALSLKEDETKEHSVRVTELTVELAKEMGIKSEDLVHIRRGALLHDIGKIGIPDAILLKKGPLTEEEWKIMKKHPEYAYEMLSPIEYLKKAIDIPYCHHERCDGKGYPRGLKGDEIPLPARIFAIADAWDALTRDRPYRKALSKSEAINLIKKESGKQFDPQIVKVFLRFIKTHPEFM